MDTNALALLGASALTVIVGLARLVAWILDRCAEHGRCYIWLLVWAVRRMKEFAKCIGYVWALSAFISLFIIGAYYLPEPWTWVCGVFLFLTPAGLIAYFSGVGHD